VQTTFNWFFASRYSNAVWELSPYKAALPTVTQRISVAYAGAWASRLAASLPHGVWGCQGQCCLHAWAPACRCCPPANPLTPPPPPPGPPCCLFPTHLAGYILVGLVNVVWMFVFSVLKPAASDAGKKAPVASTV